MTIFQAFQEFVIFGPKNGPLTHCDIQNLLEYLVPVHWECCFFSRAFWQWSNKQSTWRSKEVCRVRSPVREKENVMSQKYSSAKVKPN